MTSDAELIRRLAEHAEDSGLDPVLRRQIETSLHGVYEFNAETAKYGIVWVWIPRLVAIGLAIGAVYCAIVTLSIIATQDEVSLLRTGDGQFDFVIQAFPDEWPLYLGATFATSVGWAFFSFVTKGMSMSHKTSMKMTAEYKQAMGDRT